MDLDEQKKKQLRQELAKVMNYYSMDAFTGCPDHILASHIVVTLESLAMINYLRLRKWEMPEPYKPNLIKCDRCNKLVQPEIEHTCTPEVIK